MKTAKYLRIAGVLEVLLGVGSILALRLWLESGGIAAPDTVESAFLGLMLPSIYGVNGFKILAGLLGLCLAGRRSLLTAVLGVLLFLVQMLAFVQTSGNIVGCIINIVLLAIPYCYMYNALKIYRNL